MGFVHKPKGALSTGTCLFAIAMALQFVMPAQAQEVIVAADQPEAADAGPSGETRDRVVVTGSRIASGFETPTPVTTADASDLFASTPTNLADGLNQLPVFAGSIRTQNPTTTNQPGAYSGQNLLSLRNLGANRTLLLLNGRRLPATNSAGAVDVNVLPQGLTSRVEVVTGGASAAYGSDAVSGVINFILDTEFEGLKFNIQTGVSGHDDLASTGGTIAFGTHFLDDRGRFIANIDYFTQEGLRADETTGRDWFDFTNGRVPNPVVGAQPSFIFIRDARSSVGSYGGLITGCPGTPAPTCALLLGQHFLPGGVTAPFDFGTQTGAAYQSGGDGARANIGLMPDQTRYSAFLRSEFDLSDDLMLYGQLLYAHSHTVQGAFYNNSSGAANRYTIFADNAYLPADIAAIMAANNIPSFNLGRFERDLPLAENESLLNVYHASAGADGKLNDTWSYDASYTWGLSRQWLSINNLTINRNLYAAADAVRDPVTNQIVCRSTLMFGLDPGCTPRNLFGEQPLDRAAADYVTGTSYQLLKITQAVMAFNLYGDLGSFSLPAGAIDVALGFEYRTEESEQNVDPISASTPSYTGVRGVPAAMIGRLGGFRTNNPQAMAGKYNIKEAYVEFGVPLLADLPLVNSLDASLAARHADYSTGADKVTTWKAGLNYEMTDELRFRLTRSQDIRGANVIELFNASTQINNNTVYNGVSTPTQNFMSGNVNLLPETAQTLTYGAVYQPDWLDAFQLSIDYYDITIDDAIGTVGAQRQIDLCAQGFTSFCSLITVTPANTLIVQVPTLNLERIRRSGVDIEALYGFDFLAGRLSLRSLVTNTLKTQNQAVGSPVQSTLNSPVDPRWRASLQARYEQDNWSLFLHHRWQASSKLDPTRITGVELDPNRVPSVSYTDATFTWKFDWADKPQELFFSVTNLFDKEPPLSSPPVTAFTMAASPAYDPIGRYFNVGLRTNF